jgi:hypothetical protein
VNRIVKAIILLGFNLGSLSFSKAQTVLTDTIGQDFVISTPGSYQIAGTVVGNIRVIPSAAGDIIIEGIGDNPVLQGVPWGGNAIRSYSHCQGNAIGGSLIWRNFTFKGNGHNAFEGYDSTEKIFENLHVINYARTENGVSYDDVGSINGGENSIIRNCYLETGDDAAKLTEPNSRCYNSRIRLIKNGSAIQFGWNDRFGGPDHIADSVEIRGQLIPNIKEQDNESDNHGRCIIAGIVQNNAGNVQLTNLDIDVTNYKNFIKFLVQDGATVNPLLSDVYIQGKVTDRSIMNVEVMKSVALVAKPGSKIRNMVIDLGDKIADPVYHYINGDVDVKFIKSDGSVVEYIGGVLQTPTHAEDVSQVKNIRCYPNPFHDELIIEHGGFPYSVFDLSGRMLTVDQMPSENTSHLDLSSQPKGIYILKVNNEIQKIIKY